MDQAFRDDHKLRKYILADVTPTGRVLGTGFYGSVEEVSHPASYIVKPNSYSPS